MSVSRTIKLGIGKALASTLPRTVLRGLIERLCERDPKILLHGIASVLTHQRNLDTMPRDLPTDGPLGFEHLAGLFASTSLDHGVISMPVRQAAYLFGLVRQMKPKKVIE